MDVTLLRPRYWPGHLLMVVCVAVAVVLGLWQLDAWSERRADAARDLSNAKPVPLGTLMDGDSPFPGREVGRPVELAGTWEAGSTVYVSDRQLDGADGYWVVTPVLVDGSDSVMPVVRGWSQEPTAPEPAGRVDVVGWLQATEGTRGADEDPYDDVITSMRLASLVEHVDADLYSGYVVARDQVPAPTDGLQPVTPEAVPEVSGFTALRNFLYAVEWWVFGLFALVVWWRWCKDTLNPVDPDPVTSDEPAKPAPAEAG